MMNILHKNFLRIFLVAFIAFGSFTAGAQQLLLGWDANNNGGGFGSSPWAPVTQNANITTTGLVRGSSIGTGGQPAGGCWGGANGWMSNSAPNTADNSFHFTVVAKPGYKVSLSNITSATRRSNSGPSGYTLYYSVDNGPFNIAASVNTTVTSGTTGTPHNMTLSNIAALQNVEPGKVIRFRMNPIGIGGNYYITNGTNCLRVNGTLVPAQPESPVATDATNVISTGFVANWDEVANATGYRLDVASDAAFANILEDYDNMAVSGLSHLVNLGIQPNTPYYYRVRAEVGADVSDDSNVITTTTPNPVPAVVVTTVILPADITSTTAIAGGNVTNDGNAVISARGTVYATTANPTTASSVTTDGTGGGIFASNITALSPNVQYYYRAYATNSTGTSYGDEYSFWSHANTPGAPVTSSPGLFAMDVALDVNGNPANTLYAIRINGGGNTDQYVAATGGIANAPVWQTAAQWGAVIDVNVLQPGTEYTFDVAAQNGAGVQTPWSTTGTGTTAALAGPTTLTELTNNLDFEPACLSTDPDGAVGSFSFEATNLNGQGIGLGDVTISGPDGQPLAGIDFSTSATEAFEEGSILIEDVEEGEEVIVYVRFNPTAGVSYGELNIEVSLVDTMNSAAAPIMVETVIVDLPEAAAAQTVCNGATVADLLTTSGTNIKWYTAETGGTALAVTEVLTAQTYYASQSVGECESGRIAVVLTVNPIPVAPTADAQDFCGPSTVADLEVTTGEAPKWYSAETGSTELAETEAIASGNYYVSQTVNGCESPRTLVVVTVNPIPALPVAAPQAFCGLTTIADIEVTTGEAPKWYAAETGGDVLAETEMIATGTYYLSQTVNGCESPRAAVAVTVNPIPAAPVVDDLQPFCTTATVADLEATGEGILWYTASTGGTALDETTVLTAGTSMYYASQTVNGCESTLRSAVAVQLTAPAAPAAADQDFCGEATVSQLQSGGTAVLWYTAETGGTALEGTDELETATYYASQTINGCESAARTAVAVTVNAIPDAPAAVAQDFCGNAVVGELAVTTGANASWYAAETGGDVLAGNTALETGTYYVSQTVNGCESARTAVEVTVNEVPATPEIFEVTFCNAATVSELINTGTGLSWYEAATGGEALEGTVAVETGLYYVTQTVGTCESVRTAVQVMVNVTPAPTAEAQIFCEAGTVADLEVVTGTDVKWFADETGGTELEGTEALATGTYYVSQTLNNCEGSRAAVEVTVTEMENPEGEEIQEFEAGQTLADLEVTGDNIVWYAEETLTTELESTTVLTDGATYYAVAMLGECASTEALAVTVNEVMGTAGFDKNSLTFFPNPVNDVLNISYNEAISGVVVYNLLGQPVLKAAPNATSAQVDMSSLAAGSYIVKLSSGDSSATIKVIKR
ncbi:T9SS type A sorting domain-containing protein [uncultured Flavobacterium sp.]|uniref:Ig-like domain-containing protein n=1 Tax=uncultured Flavobacterium sp. TaxID=165435 RepID=UPI0025F60CAB|nr:T9SS type A sorting domain-containing protein [uncultured Flavobacterium sp.]